MFQFFMLIFLLIFIFLTYISTRLIQTYLTTIFILHIKLIIVIKFKFMNLLYFVILSDVFIFLPFVKPGVI